MPHVIAGRLRGVGAAGLLLLSSGWGPAMGQTDQATPPPPAGATTEPEAAAAPVPEVEESDTAQLPPANPHWLLAYTSFNEAARLIDGDAGKVLGAIHIAQLSNATFVPGADRIVVAESIWTKGNRGTRQDMLSVYDGRTLKLDHEIPLPGRLLTGNRRSTLDVSPDGRFAYIYDMSPASVVMMIDLQRRKLARTVEIAGCSGAYAFGVTRFLSICGDGTVATVDVSKSKVAVVQSSSFFNADEDPIFDNSVVESRSGRAFLLSYSGLIYEVRAGTEPQVAPAWSLQEAAGMARGSTKPLQPSWLPGGRQLIAFNPKTGRLYVLMHMGEFWSHKESGTELWEVDADQHKVLRRHKLEDHADSVAVSQDDKPILFLSTGGSEALQIIDAATFETKAEMKDLPSRLMAVLP